MAISRFTDCSKAQWRLARAAAIVALAAAVTSPPAFAILRAPIVPQPGLRMRVTTHTPKISIKTLPSGRQLKLYFVGPLIFADGDQAVLLSYQSDCKLADADELKKEIDDIWSYFKLDAGLAGYKHAVITAHETPKGTTAQSSKVKNYLFERKGNLWKCVSDPSIGEPSPEEEACDKGNELSKDGKFSESVEHYSKALEINPKSVNALLNRSIAYENLNDHKKAIADLNQLVTVSPNFVIAYVNRAWSHGKHKEYGQALEDCNKALSLDPKCAAALNNRAAVYNDLGQYEKALDDSTKAIDLSPLLAAAYDTRGVARRNLKQFKLALDDFNKALTLNPKLGEAYYNRALTYKEMGESNRAMSDEQKAKEMGFKKD